MSMILVDESWTLSGHQVSVTVLHATDNAPTSRAKGAREWDTRRMASKINGLALLDIASNRFVTTRLGYVLARRRHSLPPAHPVVLVQAANTG